MQNIPPIITTQSELCGAWETLMGPYGYRHRSLWLMLIHRDGTPLPRLTEIEKVPDDPEPMLLDQLMGLCAHLVAEQQVTVAFLLSRPGRDGLSVADRRWAGALTEAARRAMVPMQPVHRANDDNVVVVAADDIGFHGAA